MRLLTIFRSGLLLSMVSGVISGSSEDDAVTSYEPSDPAEHPSEVITTKETLEVKETNVSSTSLRNGSNGRDEPPPPQSNAEESEKQLLHDDRGPKFRSPRSAQSTNAEENKKRRARKAKTRALKANANGSNRRSKAKLRARVEQSRRSLKSKSNTPRQERRRKASPRAVNVVTPRQKRSRNPESPAKIRSKLEEDDTGDTNYTDYDTDCDYDYEDCDSIYGFAHIQNMLYDYVDETVAQVNESLLNELMDMNRKMTGMENLLAENIARTKELEARVTGGVKPNLGALRLKTSSSDGAQLKEGYLQFYSGSCWGFVCDDFFNDHAAKVACIQLGHTGENAKADSPPPSTGSADDTWKNDFEIVLDDVSCLGKEDTILSCDHSKIGENDCDMDEAVYLSC